MQGVNVMDFLEEEYFTTRSLAARYKVAYQTVQKWLEEGLFSKPGTVTVYKLPNDRVTRITATGVAYFESLIEVKRGKDE